MDSRYRAFMEVAQTLSMTQAAKTCFVSPQCISGHIRSLEKEYSVQLFRRRPALALTAEGQSLFSALQQMKVLENNLETALDESKPGFHSRITLGVPMSRYSVLVPDIVPMVKKRYPNIDIFVTGHFSSELEEMTVKGELDFAVVVGSVHSLELATIPLMNDNFYLLMSDSLLESCFPNDKKSAVEKFRRRFAIEDFKNIPLVHYPTVSRMRIAMDQYVAERGMQLNIVFESNRSETFDAIARTSLAAAIVPQMMLPMTMQLNKLASPASMLHIFPIDLSELHYLQTISLAHHKLCHMSAYRKTFITLVQDIFTRYQNISECL